MISRGSRRRLERVAHRQEKFQGQMRQQNPDFIDQADGILEELDRVAKEAGYPSLNEVDPAFNEYLKQNHPKLSEQFDKLLDDIKAAAKVLDPDGYKQQFGTGG